MRRYALRDDQWDRIKDFLPGREGHVGGTAADNRLFVDAVIYLHRTGIPWRLYPSDTGIGRLHIGATGDGARAVSLREFSNLWLATQTTSS